jgi:DNA polymerase-3 subunit gamma/tau
MLGRMDGDLVFELVAALADGDGPRLLAEVERVSGQTPDFGELLKELIGLLHRIALFQQVPGLIPADDPERERVSDLAGRLSTEDLQLYYQIALTGQPDLSLAPDPRVGFEMVLLRALAFRPAEQPQAGPTPRPAERLPSHPRTSATPPPPPGATAGAPQEDRAPVGTRGADKVAEPTAPPGDTRIETTADWHRLVGRLRVGGVASQLAHNCTLRGWTQGHLALTLDPTAEQLRSRGTEQRLREALESALGMPVQLDIQVGRPEQETPAQRRAREAEERQRRAEDAMDNDPVGARLREQLDAQWIPGSVQPSD